MNPAVPLYQGKQQEVPTNIIIEPDSIIDDGLHGIVTEQVGFLIKDYR